MVTFSSAILDSHIAPGVSVFTEAEIPDMSGWSKESPHWVGNLFLNSIFTGRFEHPMGAYAYNYVRRAQRAFTEHQLARDATIGFLSSGRRSVTKYTDALFHWECFLGQCWHAYKLLVTAWKGKAFEKGDGSIEERLNALYNQMKHVESRIENEQMPAGATVPVWMENAGLRSIDANLTFMETGDVLKDLAKYADALSNPSAAATLLSNQPKGNEGD